MKSCSKCGEDKPLSEFSKFCRAKDGYRAQCKVCDRRYRADNAKRERERHRQYRADNPDAAPQPYTPARQAYFKQRYEDKAIEIAQQQRQYRKDNPDKRAGYEAKRRALKANAPQGNPAETAAYEQILREGICELCGSHGPIHVDHIEPLSKDGEHGWENFAGLCQSCNTSKCDKALLTHMLNQAI